MIHCHQSNRARRIGGYAGLVVLLAGSALAAQAALPRPDAPTMQATTASTADGKAASVNMSFRARHPPRYPKDAIKNHAQGTVVLKVLVDAHGKPMKTEIETSSGHESLDQAAIHAAMQWRFNPGTRNGKPYKGWARVPVTFRLHPAEPATARSSTQAVRVVPASKRNNPPAYPPSAIKNHQQGTVMLLVHVDANGKVLDTKIEKSSGIDSLDIAAIKAAKNWQFSPRMAHGKPHGGWVEVPVTFSLKPDLVLLNPTPDDK